MAQLNLDQPKKYKTQNLEVLDSWIDQIMQGTISLDGTCGSYVNGESLPASLCLSDDDEPPPPPPPPPAKGRRGKKEL